MATMDVLNAAGGTETIEKPMSVENNTLLTSILAKLNASLAVTGTFFQATQPVSGTVTANAVQSGTWNITNISGTISLPTGASTSANQTSTNTKLDTIITSLSTIDGRVDGLEGVLGTATDAAAANGAAGTIDAHLRAIKDGVTDTTTSNKVVSGYDEWETVAASQTDQALGATGATGDRLSHVLIIPATTAAGAVSIKDGAGSAITIFAGGGTTALTTLIPFAVPLGLKSLAGAWKITTGANVSAIGVGDFT